MVQQDEIPLSRIQQLAPPVGPHYGHKNRSTVGPRQGGGFLYSRFPFRFSSLGLVTSKTRLQSDPNHHDLRYTLPRRPGLTRT